MVNNTYILKTVVDFVSVPYRPNLINTFSFRGNRLKTNIHVTKLYLFFVNCFTLPT